MVRSLLETIRAAAGIEFRRDQGVEFSRKLSLEHVVKIHFFAPRFAKKNDRRSADCFPVREYYWVIRFT